jgi:hypothetical protein
MRMPYSPIALKRSVSACAATALLGLAVHAPAHTQSAAGPAVLQSIRVVPAVDGSPTTVILEASGPLPEPEGDSLAGPARVFVDLQGVVAAPSLGRTGKDPLVLRARVARHSDVPLVTRVVLDLSRVSRFRVDASERAAGRLVLTLEGSAAAARPTSAQPAPRAKAPESAAAIPAPVRSTSPAAQPAAPISPHPAAPFDRARDHAVQGRGDGPEPKKSPVPSRIPRLRQNAIREPSASQVEAYTAQILALVNRLQGLRPLLLAIDRRGEITTDLNAAAAEFDEIGRILTAIKPIPARAGTHGLLLQACVLGARAARTLQDATASRDAAAEWNAASAAAGALILLDRAIADIG